MTDKFQELADLGAGDFDHIDGSLMDHLNGTTRLLCEWGAATELQDAGLFHAAYGTAGFDENLASTDQRREIAKIIGAKAEEIVYQYCACDRKDFFEKFASKVRPKFRNRFTKKFYYLSDEMMESFCELTAANEIEIATNNPAFKAEYGSALNDLFTKMTPYLSRHARAKTTQEFGGNYE